MKLFLQLFFLAISFSLSAQNSNNQIEEKWKQDISKAAIKELNNSGTPSLQIAIGYKDSIIYEKAFGLADIENNVLATTETKYRTASISKWWTATAAMILVDQGKLDLDKPIQNYCLSFPEKSSPITARQLLTQTSGIRAYIEIEEELAKATNSQDSLHIENRKRIELLGSYTHYTDLEPSLDNFKEDPILFEPGTDWSYSSHAYRVLGCVLEGASGMSYQSLIKELVFRPTAMENTTEDDSWAIIPNRASGYRLEREKSVRRADMRDVSENLPAGGHLTTASDLVRFAQAFNAGKFFSSKTITLMSTPYFENAEILKTEPTWRDAIPSKEKYGYGVMRFSDPVNKKLGHTGRQSGASSIVFVIPEKDITISVLTNSKGWRGYISFTQAIEDIVIKIIDN
ncbi:beta-lactamase family protein [Flagellimonas sp. 389]|uniref:serine hydrolase domain-containing protein n=1 Tax=Flagellimonas sp. 389 TaxID=2835862 RepID=UPI001BD3012D|nr:serine hydrolase domain-containing protein [Flagellimonas sp. 389]MBS9463000.1 beta-lactamase family protein [Flagellimonas sp. 389]